MSNTSVPWSSGPFLPRKNEQPWSDSLCCPTPPLLTKAYTSTTNPAQFHKLFHLIPLKFAPNLQKNFCSFATFLSTQSDRQEQPGHHNHQMQHPTMHSNEGVHVMFPAREKSTHNNCLSSWQLHWQIQRSGTHTGAARAASLCIARLPPVHAYSPGSSGRALRPGPHPGGRRSVQQPRPRGVPRLPGAARPPGR